MSNFFDEYVLAKAGKGKYEYLDSNKSVYMTSMITCELGNGAAVQYENFGTDSEPLWGACAIDVADDED